VRGGGEEENVTFRAGEVEKASLLSPEKKSFPREGGGNVGKNIGDFLGKTRSLNRKERSSYRKTNEGGNVIIFHEKDRAGKSAYWGLGKIMSHAGRHSVEEKEFLHQKHTTTVDLSAWTTSRIGEGKSIKGPVAGTQEGLGRKVCCTNAKQI